MTIVFRGHVAKLESHLPGKVRVSIVTEASVCGQTIELLADEAQAMHWMPGSMVSITAYTLPDPAKEDAS